MLARDVDQVLRWLAWSFGLALLLQLRIDQRAILLPVFVAAVVWWLVRMRPFADAGALRAPWRATVAAAVVSLLASLAALVPALEAGAMNVVIAVAIIVGLATYGRFLQRWAERDGWDDIARGARAARSMAILTLGLLAVSLVLLVAFVSPADADAPAWFAFEPLLGRPIDGWGSWLAVLLITIGWVAALVCVGETSKALRKLLQAEPDRDLAAGS